ncbi:hypothetical protein GCM10027271_45980 [Saccharopolyspora gloriosae]|uniref:Uncharacterized protein n=1 Tax=Saccharopolyspora gloriosae TaxID=455344 RepID=A0A840NGF9_9PSEU|nr:hypothetical protein [Saccharopolyspora gloriosae]MBB5070101.1 hypothetical protein [Saccharopolyspora gloriosae]
MTEGTRDSHAPESALAPSPEMYDWSYYDSYPDSGLGNKTDSYVSPDENFMVDYVCDLDAGDLLEVRLWNRESGDDYWQVGPDSIGDALQDPEGYARDTELVHRSPYVLADGYDPVMDPVQYGWIWGVNRPDDAGNWNQYFVAPSSLGAGEDYRLECRTVRGQADLVEATLFTVDADGEEHVRGQVRPDQLPEVLRDPSVLPRDHPAAEGTSHVDGLMAGLKQRIEAIHKLLDAVRRDNYSPVSDSENYERYEGMEMRNGSDFHSGLGY